MLRGGHGKNQSRTDVGGELKSAAELAKGATEAGGSEEVVRGPVVYGPTDSFLAVLVVHARSIDDVHKVTSVDHILQESGDVYRSGGSGGLTTEAAT